MPETIPTAPPAYEDIDSTLPSAPPYSSQSISTGPPPDFSTNDDENVLNSTSTAPHLPSFPIIHSFRAENDSETRPPPYQSVELSVTQLDETAEARRLELERETDGVRRQRERSCLVVISVNTVIRGVDSVIAVLSKGYHGFAPFFYIEFALYSSISILHPLCSIFIFLITIWNRKTKRENIFYPLLIICSLLWGGFTVIYALNDADSFDPPNLTISLIFFVAHFVYIGVLVLVGVLLLTSIFKLFLQNDSQNRSSILLTVLFVASSNAIWIYSDVTCFERLLEHLKYGTLLFSYPQMSFYSNTTMDYEIHSSNSARQAQMSSRTILLVHQLFPVIYFAIAICVLLKLHYKRRIPKENKVCEL
ncbi:unnamed protein product, partial [Mesorhabditis belari]|uniref:Uncharacterized protein n=1 Tax=Mesorhabditis belari TaxID=2138241 RepID=A0AAF3FMQ1_9BILA